MPTLLKVVLLSFLWGPSYLFIKIAVQEIPPLTMQVGRIGLASLIISAVVALRRISMPRDARTWLTLSVMGVLASALPFTLFAIGEQYIDSALAAVINGVVPGVTALLAHLFVPGERLTRRKGAGVLVGLLGFLLLLTPTLTDGSVDSDTIGMLCIFVAGCSYGAAMVVARNHLSHLPPLVAPAGQLLTATLLITPLALLYDQPQTLPIPSLTAIGSILFLAIMGTACAFILYYHIIQTAGATATASVAYLLPVVGAFLGWAVRGERLALSAWLAVAVIFVGMYLINSDRSGNEEKKYANN